jgi:stalled ribosome alternative rescue factor ArfA
MKGAVMKNVAAKSLADRKFQQRIVLAKKGRGSYTRKHKYSNKEIRNA